MTLGELLQDLYRRLGFDAMTPDQATTARLTALLNETQQEILSEPGMESLLWDSMTFASVASTPTYGLPQAVARVRSITETTNDQKLFPMSLDAYRLQYPDPTAVTGTPDRWVDLGYDATAVEPADASELFVKSTSASDTGVTLQAWIEGYITGGYYRTANVALTGTTAVSFSSAITNWINVTKFYVDFTSVGQIVLTEDSTSGTELARIGVGQRQARYRKIALAQCPSSAITYTVDFERDAHAMVNVNDEPIIPPRFHRLLGIGARMREYEKQDQARYKAAQSEYLYGLKKLKYFVYSQSVGTPNLRGHQATRPSRLGGQYPVDRW